MGKAMNEWETMPAILTINGGSSNGGSSSIKFALSLVGEPLNRGKIERIEMRRPNLTSNHPTGKQSESLSVIPEQTRLHEVRCNLPARIEYTTAMEKTGVFWLVSASRLLRLV